MFWTWYIMLSLFEMFTKLALIRLQSCGVFAHLLVFEVKGEVDNAKVVQARLRLVDSWYTFPDISELCLHKEIRSMAQDKQFDIKHALSKWQC